MLGNGMILLMIGKLLLMVGMVGEMGIMEGLGWAALSVVLLFLLETAIVEAVKGVKKIREGRL